MSDLTLRTTFYSLTLALALMNQGLGIYLSITSDFSPNQWKFAIIIAATSFYTWIWTTVLLIYNNRPLSTHALTKASAHYYSFLPLVPIYFAAGIMILSQVHYNCGTTRYSDGEAEGWCGSGATAGSLSIVQSFIAAFAVWSIRRSVAASPDGLRSNVSNCAGGDKTASLTGQA
ncbi:hypothetical protein BJ912DRAFT_1065018 [Pholiota molesta]|nr:hypothetical protein BJ912DRAFT_1065018 [Pholiota molesta]